METGVLLERPGWDAGGSAFATDFRAKVDSLQIWPFSVHAPAKQAARLMFAGVADVPPELQVHLIDDGRARSINLREHTVYEFTPPTPVTHFRIAVGTGEAVREILTELVPITYALHQNFPNPFNPTTTISYQVPVTSNVRLVVYDVLGREVRVLIDGIQETGRYSLFFDAMGLASGMYVCRMSAGEYSECMKMLLLR
jgi:hypothetical protein